MLDSLGINPIQLLAQIVSFWIIYYALNRFLFPQVRKALDERKAAVVATLEGKAAIETRLAEFAKEQAASQKKAGEDAQRMLNEAKEQAAATKADLVGKAREAGEAELASAKTRIEQEKVAADAEVAKNAKSIAQSIVQQLLNEKATDANWQQEQIKAGIDALKSSKS